MPPVTRRLPLWREGTSRSKVQYFSERPGFFPANLFIFSPFSFRSRFALNFLTVWSKTWWFPDQKFNYEVILILTRNKIFWGSLINYRILIEKLATRVILELAKGEQIILMRNKFMNPYLQTMARVDRGKDWAFCHHSVEAPMSKWEVSKLRFQF